MKAVFLFVFLIVGCSQVNNPITLTIVRHPVVEFSLKPEESDFLTNFILLDHLVETLFKNSQAGAPEPSAVKEWSSSQDQLVWNFTLKSELVDEKAEKLTPSYWCSGLERVVKRLPKPENMILLSRLEGWKEYLAGKRAFPVLCDDAKNTIVLKFSEKPEGILDYLSMPVLGFWKNADQESFVASGAFKITKRSASQVEMERIGKTNKAQYRQAIIRGLTADQVRSNGISANELVMPVEPINELKANATLIKAYPTQLIFAELNDSGKRILGETKLRKELYLAISRFKHEKFKFSDEAVKTDGVFFDVQPKSKVADKSPEAPSKLAKLKVLVSGSGVGATRDVVNGILKEVLPQFTEKVEVIELDTSDEMWQIVINRDYDLRIGAVESGTHPNKWVAEMMFCSHQGITFIDPGKKICQGLKMIKDSEGDKVGEMLNRVTSEAYVLLPLFNKSALTYVGKGIDDSGIYAGSPMPRLDRLKVHE